MISIRICARNQNKFQNFSQLFFNTCPSKDTKLCKNDIVRRFLHRNALNQKLKEDSGRHNTQIAEQKDKPFSELSLGQKVARTGKDASYLTVIVIGVSITGAMFYMIGRELFSRESPNGVYSTALKDCTNDVRIEAALGKPIKGYGETTRRGRRRFTSHSEYEVEGVKHIRMKFYIEGPHNKGTVHLEKVKDPNNKYQYRYMFVDLDNSNRSIIIEDNRQMLDNLLKQV
ncbi:unnamed protein product [Owenia fusiformis]|uniref:Mitochondrial import inner membrane translocase subunit Tim21 n=1 Tax=Owenia fusiformis TaxID=6347 RepID=A0A8J1UT06_OWEFU|nr:unnamed protein product [Owenia fusiformis]